LTSNARPPDDSAKVADASEIVIVVVVRFGATKGQSSFIFRSFFSNLLSIFDKK
jgi:hypothetical protein